MHLLKQSTAVSTLVGPVLDSTGAAYTSMAIGDFNITKNGSTAAMASAATATHSHNGHYVIALTTGNTDTLGQLEISCNKATYAMGMARYTVLTAATYDALVTNAAGAASGLFIAGSNAATTVNITGNLSGSVGSVSGAVNSVATAITLPTMPSNWITATGITAGALNGKGDWLLSSGYTSPPTTTAIATAIWQDATAGDFTATGSIGKSLFTSGNVPGTTNGLFIAGTNAATTITTSLTTHLVGTVDTVTTLTNLPAVTTNWLTGAGVDASAVTKIQTGLATPTNITAGTITTATNVTNLPTMPTGWVTATGIATSALNGKGDWLLSSSYTAPSTAAQIATAVWQDTTAGDFTTASSIGKSLYNAFTTNTSVFTTESLVNAPTGGSAPTAAQIATAVWQDTTAGDFNVASSIGLNLKTGAAVPGGTGGHFIAGTNAATTITTSLTTHLVGTIDTVTTLTNLPSIPTNWLTATGIATSALNGKGDWLLSSGYTAPPTTGAIATAVWQDATAGDFTTANSIGKSLYNAFTVGTSVFTTASLVNAPAGGGSGPTAAQIATAVWQDATAGDFTSANSIGKSLYNAFTAGTSVFTSASLANAPSGGVGGPTAVQIATAIWQDTTVSDFTVPGSIGMNLKTGNAGPGLNGGHFIAGTNAATVVDITGSLSGSVGSVLAAPNVASIATAVWQDALSSVDFTTTNSIGQVLKTSLIGSGSGTPRVSTPNRVYNAW